MRVSHILPGRDVIGLGKTSFLWSHFWPNEVPKVSMNFRKIVCVVFTFLSLFCFCCLVHRNDADVAYLTCRLWLILCFLLPNICSEGSKPPLAGVDGRAAEPQDKL